jgi:hypothetical protein
MDQTSTLMAAVFLGAFGMGFLAYAKRQRDPVCLVTGLALCAFPYFVHNVWLVAAIGAALIAFPFVLKRLA